MEHKTPDGLLSYPPATERLGHSMIEPTASGRNCTTERWSLSADLLLLTLQSSKGKSSYRVDTTPSNHTVVSYSTPTIAVNYDFVLYVALQLPPLLLRRQVLTLI